MEPGLGFELAALAVVLAGSRLVASPSAPPEHLASFTPAQVAELLNLTEPYVHAIRRRRGQETTSGKHWTCE